MPRRTMAWNPHKERKIMKLCIDVEQDRKKWEKIANDPNCKIIETQYNSTPKGVLWMTVQYDESIS